MDMGLSGNLAMSFGLQQYVPVLVTISFKGLWQALDHIIRKITCAPRASVENHGAIDRSDRR